MKAMFKKNDKGSAVCECTNAIIQTTYLYRDVVLSNGVVVEKILVGVCDECSSTVSLTPQSSIKIKDALLTNK